MKRIGLMLSLLTVLFCSSLAMAAEGTSGFYGGVLGGYVMPQDVGMTGNTGSSAPIPDLAQNKGYLVGLKVGYIPSVAKFVAAELEYNYAKTSFDNGKTYTTNWGTWTADGTTELYAVFFNVKLRYPDGWFHPYVGVGPGYAWVKQGDITISTQGTLKGDTASKFAYQLLAGVDFDITKNWGVGLGYKYYQVKPSFGGGLNVDTDNKAHVITLGVNYSF
jgi:opacity protein-like surface antigen